MSSSDEENFDLDVSGSESDDFAPAPKKKTVRAHTAERVGGRMLTAVTTDEIRDKASRQGKSASKTQSDGCKEEDDDFIDDDGAGPSVPRVAPAATNGKKKTASETYQKLSQLEHILKRPDSYIGSVETVTHNIWTYDSDSGRMVLRDVRYVPGFFKIVDEILVNAADNKINDPNMNMLKIDIDPDAGTISVYNNGKGIPIEIHSKEKIWIPELIFGHLLSSSNYDDDEKKLTGGRNGYGAKLANIYSTSFTVETADKNTGKKYKQTWTDNMGKCGKAKITENGKGEEFTRVSFTPDLARFGMEHIDEDTVSLLKKRVYDMAGTVRDVKVYLNGKMLKVRGFKQYVDMYLNSAAEAAAENSGGAAQAKQTVIYERPNDRWEIAFAVSDGQFQHVSFANSISTIKGGTHVNTVADQLAKELGAAISKKNKAAAVKPAKIKEHMWIFVNALIENPTFDSQTKETLTLPAAKFGSKPKLSEDFMKKVLKSAIVDNILNWAKFRADQQIKKTDGTKRNRLTGLPKLADANNAGTRHAEDCTLILTEGDSAKALAVAGLGVVGRDNFGVFPLRGKLLNVREARHEQIMKNEEIQNIKKIMGLQHSKEYNPDNIKGLRYGQLMIMTDQDHDGSHIKGLLINFLDHFFPSLLKVPRFLVEFVTPIVRVTKGNQRRDFFTIPEYEQWLEATPDAHKWASKYYKGLGTSKDEDARDYFSHMEKHMIPFAATQPGDKELIELAFSKKKADDRKEWLRQFKPGTYLNHDTDQISYSDFINKELILFSMADNIRSIPSAADGLKPGQRKVIWACFKRNLKKEIKAPVSRNLTLSQVAQLVGYISEHAAYHHGEISLTMTIVNLAQDYIGSNNMNVLLPNGQFGTRDQGGKDHASARYIFTDVSPITRAVFHPSDDPLLTYLKDDNDLIEPEYYMPVLPMLLVNGAEGIGTGWSTSVPSYNPADIVMNIRRLMGGEEIVPMDPWWRGFKGTVKKTGENKYDVTGCVRRLDDTSVEITELPIHRWTQNYKQELEGMIGEKGDGAVKDYKEHHDNRNVHFIVNMSKTELDKAEAQGLVEYFKLTTKLNTSNMICFDFDGKIKKYNSPEEIIEDFYPKRLAYYQRRKDYLANELQNQFEKLSNQARFVQMIVNKELTVSNRKKAEIVTELRKLEFRPFPKIAKAKAAGELEEVVEAEEEEAATGAASDYDYLLGMPISSLTREKIEKLLQQAADKERELLALLELTPIKIWNTDLDNFLSHGKKVKRKQTKIRTRDSLGGARRRKDSDDEDFKPTMKAAAKKAAVSKATLDDDDDNDNKPAKKPPARKTKREDDSDGGDFILKKPAAPARKAKPAYIEMSVASKKAAMEDDPAPRPRTKKTAPQPKDEPDSGDDLVAARAAAGKRKSPDDSDDDDPPAKKAAVKKAKQAEVTDFFNKKAPAPTRKPASSKAAAKKRVDDSDDGEISHDASPPPAPRTAAPRRAAAKTSAYIELSDDDDE
ncbi:type II DNA topoisomerase [Vararia minispora EC-137]|uniref:Type II DNA topoisomerase n=1 Tax=Vararia minispora EC-137 TaxID=1314806 RepID=A0ACB8QB88_9AGAM|nr:type II DNA topoisomerase [Vararia minispora EC-137]